MEDKPVLEILVDAALEVYNSHGFYSFSVAYPNGATFREKVSLLLRMCYPTMTDRQLTLVTFPFYYFVRNYLDKFRREQRFVTINKYWRDDLLSEVALSYVVGVIENVQNKVREPLALTA